ncbi:MAG TPA: ATP-binding protein [Pyrinomonadaceae bacterium]|nr:ATP-binding protein [Pyrinomonadaceae bacterium]
MRSIQSMEVADDAQVGAARRAVHSFAKRVGFTERELAEIDIVVQEIGTNAVRYATGGGWVHFAAPLGAEPGLELFYCDKGPGIPDIDRAVRDGVTTGGSLGAGLGAIRRLMHEFDFYSSVPAPRPRGVSAGLRRTTHGTALLCRKWVEAARLEQHHAATTRRYGAWSRPRPGETANGDAYFVRRRAGATLLAVIDGLGHGHGAQEAARGALEVLSEWQGEGLDTLFLKTHDRLRSTRGAVMGACVVDTRREAFYYAGVGNVEVRVFNSPEPIRPVSANGTLGARLGKLRVWQSRWGEGATVVLASDGLSASWDMGDYPGLLQKSPQLIAGVLLRDYSRGSDDATILVARP